MAAANAPKAPKVVPSTFVEKSAKNLQSNGFLFGVLRKLLGPYLGCSLVILPNLYLLIYVISVWAHLLFLRFSHISNIRHHSYFLSGIPLDGPTIDEPANTEFSILEWLHLQNISSHLGAFLILALAVYPPICTYYYYKYDVKQRGNPETWKCQPDKFLTAELEYEGFIDASKGLLTSVLLFGTVVCYYFNEGPLSKVYFSLSDSPLWWTIIQFPILAAYHDFIGYWYHRFYHYPLMYKTFHKLHHKYKFPAIFTAVAVHPLELTHFYMNFLIPSFVIPLYFPLLFMAIAYMFFTPFYDHTGFNFQGPSWLPWKSDVIYHDEHHRVGTGNFGFHSSIWDKFYGTSLTPKRRVESSPQVTTNGQKCL